MKSPISVIIRTSSSEKALSRLFGRMEKGEDDELIIVDTNSEDGTRAVAERAGAKVVSNTNRFNYSSTLNLGFAAAKNDWILSLSAHCVPIHRDMLERYRMAIDEVPDNTAVLYGLQYWSKQQYARVDPAVRIFDGKNGDLVEGASNANALYSRKVWIKHPFDEALPTGEDIEWQKWASQAGFRSASVPAAAVYYLHRGGPRYRFTKAWNETLVHKNKVDPMSITGLLQGIAQASRRLLWEARAPRPWIGQIAHQLGAFFASRSMRNCN